MLTKRFNQTGDTIVEVLIAIAVAAAVLGSAYGIVSRTIRSQQQTSEHADALKLSETQIERIRANTKVPSNPNSVFTTSLSPFCMDNSNNPISGAGCNHTIGGTPVTQSITRTGDASIGFTFTVTVSWSGIHGTTDSVTLVYKI